MSSTTSKLENPGTVEEINPELEMDIQSDTGEVDAPVVEDATEVDATEVDEPIVEGQTLQLGDVLLFHSPNNEIYNNNSFIIEYIDDGRVNLININDLQKRTLQIKDGILGDGSIERIELIYRNPEKGYARQNGLLPGKWVNIYFGGEYPTIITGRISNLESDMIELTLPDNDVIYLNFAYKGLPDDLPVETIELREPPEPVKEVEAEEPIVDADASLEDDEFQQLEGEEGESDSERKRRQVDVSVEKVKDQAREFIIYANEIKFGEELGPIKQYVGVDASKQRFNIDAQTNDLLDELLSDIPSVERTTNVLNNIHIMIERFKQLRLSFSSFDEYGNVVGALRKDANWKPLAKDLEKFKTALYWLLPVAKNTKKLYNVKYDEESENQTILSLDLTDDLMAMDNIIKTYKAGSAGEEQSKYVTLMSDLDPYQTPFEDVNPENTSGLIYEENVETNLNVIIDNLGDFYSSVAVNDNIKTRRFLIQKYNLGQNRLEATNFKGASMISKVVPLTRADNLQLSSILTLPEPAIVFSQINLPGSSILQKANLNRNFISYWQILKKTTAVENIMVDDLEKELDFEQGDENAEGQYLSNIKNYVLAEKDKDLSSYENYSKFLSVIIPKTRVLFNLVKKYIKDKLTLKDVVGFLEPFLIYTDDLTYMQYKEINQFLQQKMINYKKSFVEKSKVFTLLKNVAYRQSSDPSSKAIKDLFNTNVARRKEVMDAYSERLMDEKLTNSELLLKLCLRDFGNLYNVAVSLENIVLMLPNNVTKFLEDEEDIAKDLINEADEKNTCKKYVVAKQYSSVQDLEADNGKKIYYDKAFDKTNYGILDDYEKEQISMKPDDFEEFLKGKLITKHKYDVDDVPIIANALLDGMREVTDGDLAIVYLNDENDYAYYGREGTQWTRMTDLTDQNIVSKDNNVLCNLQKECIEVDKKIKSSCESMDLNKAQLEETALKQMINAFDKKYQYSKEVQKDFLEKKFEYCLDVMPSLEKIEKNSKYKYNKEHYEMGLSEKGEEIAPIVSPYAKLRDAILGTEDFVKKQNDIVRFCRRFTREATPDEVDSDPRNDYWLYCTKTNTWLMPFFYFALAKAYLISEEDYLDEMAQIIRAVGKLSDDGDMWVDKNSGYPIKAIDYDVEEGYETSGFKMKSRDLLEQDIGDSILKIAQQQGKKSETKETRIINNVVTFLSGSMGVNMSDKREFISKVVLDAFRVALSSEPEYKKKVQEMAKKGKKLPSYNEIYNLTILYLCLGAFLIAAQTSIPSIKTRKTYPGCVRAFDGYPLEGKTGDFSGINYLACVAEKSKSAIEPWSALKGSKADKIKEKIIAFTDNYLLKHSDVIRKLEEKVEYVMSNPRGEQIPDEYNLLKWNNFLPPLLPFKIKSNLLENVSSSFKKVLLDDLKSGSDIQREKLLVLQSKTIFFSLAIQELIQKVVSEKEGKLLLTNAASEPFLENSCCNENNDKTTIQYFEDVQPNIKRYNEIVEDLSNILTDINAITRASYMFSRENTKNIYPPLTDQYNEETIYLAFIKYCRFGNLIPMNEDLLSICSDKPEPGFLTNKDSLSEKIRKLKQSGRDYNNEQLLRLMQVVERHNILDINVNQVKDQPIQKFRDLLESIQSEKDSVISESLVKNLNEVLDSYYLTVEEDNEEMRSFKNYLSKTNKVLKEGVFEFIKSNSKLSRTSIRNVKAIIDGLMKWEKMGDELETEGEAETEAETAAEKNQEHSISDNIRYNSLKFIKEFMRNMIVVFPTMILNKVDFNSVKIQKYLKLSTNHERDIANSIRDYYATLRPFYDDEKLEKILTTIQTKCNNLLLLAMETPSFTDIFYKGKSVHNVFDKRTSIMLFENYVLQALMTYANLADNEEMVNLSMPESDSNEDDAIVTTEQIELAVTAIEPKEQVSDIILSGNLADLKERVAKLLIAFLNIMRQHKGLVDMSYENIMDILFKTKEKEKDTFTDRLKAMNDEERDVDTALKINKLGAWNKGLKKGLTQYVAEDYDDERDEMEKLAQVEKTVRRNKQVSEENMAQFVDDYLDEERNDEEIDREDNDLSGLRGEGDDSDYDVDQDDQADNQWSGWEQNDD